MLKKLIIVSTLGVLVTAATAQAAINVIYSGVNGFYRSDDLTGLTEPATGSQTALAQLIFSTVNGYGLAGIGATVGATEQILHEALITDSAGTDIYGTLAATSFTDTFQAGWLYVRIFDQGTGLGGAGVANGTWYYDSPIYATINNITPDSPDAVNAHGANPSSQFADADFLNKQVVPEPSILAFFGVGGLTLAIRRRIKA